MQTFEELKAELFKDPKVRQAYDNLGPEYELTAAIIRSRLKRKMSQKQLAARIGTTQSAICRLESGEGNPSFKFLKRVAQGLGAKLHISFV